MQISRLILTVSRGWRRGKESGAERNSEGPRPADQRGGGSGTERGRRKGPAATGPAGRIIAVWLIIAVFAALYPLLAGYFFSSGDVRDVFIPLEDFFRQELLAGRLPAWQPDIAWGFPVIASAQIGFFYPPLLVLRMLPLPLYMTITVLIHVAALALGTYLFGRTLHRSPPAAYLSAISFALGSFIAQHLTQLNIIITVAWLPWQLLVVHRTASRHRIFPGHIALLAAVLGLPFLAGQMHMPVLLTLLSSAYFLYIRRQQRISWSRSLTVLLAALSLALTLGAAQLLPTAELVLHSSRGPTGDYDLGQANQHSFPLYHLPTLIFPRFFGSDDTYWGKRLEVEYGIFVGTIPLFLALISLRHRRHPHDAFFRWLTVISFLLALGSLSPFRLLGLEPSFWFFSAPARWLLFTTFALSLAAAPGFDALRSRARALRALSTRAAALLALIIAGSTIFLFTITEARFAGTLNELYWGSRERPDEYYSDKLSQLLASARSSSASLASPYTALPLILLTALPYLLSRRFGARVILVATTAELILVFSTSNPVLPWPNILAPPATLAALPPAVRAGSSRLLTLPADSDTGLHLTNPASRHTAAERAAHYQLLPPLMHARFALPGVEWPASLALDGHAEKLDAMRDVAAGILTSQANAMRANIGAVISPAASLNRDAGQSTFIQPLNAFPRADGADHVTYESITPGLTRITVDASSHAAIVVRDSFYPGWQAYLDDHLVPIERAENIFRRVLVPAGQHTIEFRYVPTVLYAGLITSAAGAVICAALMLKRSPA